MMAIRKGDTSNVLHHRLRLTFNKSKKFWFIPRLMLALFKLRPFEWLAILFYTILEGLIRIALHISLIFLLRSLGNESSTNAYIWAGVMSGLVLIQTFNHHILFFLSMRLGWHWRTATTAFIYEGLFNLNGGGLQSTMSG
jgi:hypothetical protein